MKQGRSTTKAAGQHRNPISRGVNPGAVADLGTNPQRTKPNPMFTGKSGPTPKSGRTVHPKGSQGKHK